MAHKVFLVHGMGKPSDGWADSVKAELKELYEQKLSDGSMAYPLLAHLAFGTRFELIEIRYDQFFQRILDGWKAALDGDTDADEFKDRVTKNSNVPGWYEELNEQLSEAADSDEFFWTHAFDVLLYRYSPMVRQEVMNFVAQQMGEKIMEISGGMGNWSVIAHSLGTAVTHDALHMLFSAGQLPDGRPTGFDETDAQANAVIMVANVSRVLQTDPRVLSDQTTIRPGYPAQPGHGCLRYVNINHELDPFTLVKEFGPDLWPDGTAETERRYINVKDIKHIQDWNVHDLLHYLRHPWVHAEIFRALETDYVITDAQIGKVIETFKGYGDFTQEEWVEIRQALQDMLKLDGVDNTIRAFKVLKEAYDRLREFVENLQDTDDESEDTDADANGDGDEENDDGGDEPVHNED